jgi:hypothetical protein
VAGYIGTASKTEEYLDEEAAIRKTAIRRASNINKRSPAPRCTDGWRNTGVMVGAP